MDELWGTGGLQGLAGAAASPRTRGVSVLVQRQGWLESINGTAGSSWTAMVTREVSRAFFQYCCFDAARIEPRASPMLSMTLPVLASQACTTPSSSDMGICHHCGLDTDTETQPYTMLAPPSFPLGHVRNGYFQVYLSTE